MKIKMHVVGDLNACPFGYKIDPNENISSDGITINAGGGFCGQCPAYGGTEDTEQQGYYYVICNHIPIYEE